MASYTTHYGNPTRTNSPADYRPAPRAIRNHPPGRIGNDQVSVESKHPYHLVERNPPPGAMGGRNLPRRRCSPATGPSDNMGSVVKSPWIPSPDTSRHDQNMAALTDGRQHGLLGQLQNLDTRLVPNMWIPEMQLLILLGLFEAMRYLPNHPGFSLSGARGPPRPNASDDQHAPGRRALHRGGHGCII